MTPGGEQRGYLSGGGMPVPIETGDKARLEYWRTQTKSVPPDVLRALGWLTSDRRVVVNDPDGTKEVKGNEAVSDVLFLRPRNAETERTWEFVLQLGHRRVQVARLVALRVAETEKQLVDAQKELTLATKTLEEGEAAREKRRGMLELSVRRFVHDGREAELRARDDVRGGMPPSKSKAFRRIRGAVLGARKIRARVHELETERLPFLRAVRDAERTVARLESKRIEWSASSDSQVLPGLLGSIGAFLTREQMNVASRATEELSRAPSVHRVHLRESEQGFAEDRPIEWGRP